MPRETIIGVSVVCAIMLPFVVIWFITAFGKNGTLRRNHKPEIPTMPRDLKKLLGRKGDCTRCVCSNACYDECMAKKERDAIIEAYWIMREQGITKFKLYRKERKNGKD